jgi:DnaJ-domain-containing protein 1
MNIINWMLGKTIYGFAKGLAFVLDGFISVTETGILMAKSFLKGCAVLISMGGCLFILLLIGPLGTWLLINPQMLLLFLLILFFPIFGAIFIVYLKYLKYITTEYLFHLSRYLIEGETVAYRSFDYFRQAYRKAEEEKVRQEQRRRQEQQREWEERFRQWHQQNAQWGQGTFQGGFGGYQRYTGQQGYGQQGFGQQAASNPYVAFKNKYRKSCEVLGVPENADQYKIKLAYRRKAKEHHPDVNNDPNATRKFQEINEAYEFLNEDNIQRYQRMQ